MKFKYTITIVLFLSVIPLGLCQCLSDNFNTSYGNWTASNTYTNTTAGYEGKGVGFNATTDNLVTQVAITSPQSIQFLLARSPSTDNRTLSIEYSTSMTGPWTEAGLITVDQTNETHQLFSIDLNLIGEYYIQIIMSDRDGGSYYLDDVTIYCGGANTPELQLLDEYGNLQNCGFEMDFGSTATNASVEKSFTIKNTGDVNLEVSTSTITSHFTSNIFNFPLIIPPNETLPITVTFQPNTTGVITGELHILNSDTNENDCIISLIGNGFTPAPEIDIERNSGASIPSEATANTGYNTVFAATVVGEATTPKTYYIHNEGELDLIVGEITSSNPSEFQIISNPSNSTIPNQTKIDFFIQFTPLSSGIRSSIITILNNDDNENPYTFEVQGTGKCSSATLLAQPNNGPAGTVVTITASNFGTATTANLNGIPADTHVISDTEIEVTIPEHSSSGNLSIINDLGCQNTTNFNLLTNKTTDCDGDNGYTPTHLFISEITDHPNGSHSYIEIFNGSGETINMEDYSLEIHYNATTVRTIEFESSTLDNQDVFVIAFGATDANYPHSTHGYDLLSNLVGINNNDNIRLLHNGNWIDLWGNISGDSFTISQKGYTYRRKNNIQNTPSTIWNTNDWEAFTTVDYTNIGTYDFSIGTAPTITSQPSHNNANCSLTTQLSTTANEGVLGQKNLSYQWLVNTPESDTWVEVLDDENHIGAQSQTLTITNTTNVNKNQYYCRVLEDSNLCFIATNSNKISVNKSVWTGSAWENDIAPTVQSLTIIDNNYNTLLHGNLTTCGLYIPIENSLIVGANSFAKVTNTLHIEGELLVKDKGSFVQSDDSNIINSGTITVEKETAILNTWDEYTYWSSPVKNETFNNVFSHSKRLFWYKASNFVDIYKEENNNNAQELGQDDVDDDANDWQSIGELEAVKRTDYLAAGVGYAATHSNTNFIEGNTYTYSFSGDFNNGTILTPVERNDVSLLDGNWNLIGNPYPSAIDVSAFFDANVNVRNPEGTLEGVIYLWSHDSPISNTNNGNYLFNYSPSDYAIINGSGAIAAQEGTGTIPDNFIPSCQGFFVKFSNDYPSPSGHVIFNNAMRVTDKNTQFFRPTKSNKIWVNLTSDNGIFNQTLVSYITGANDSYDGVYYDLDLNITKDVHAKLYSRITDTDKKLTIQGKATESITTEEQINLGFYSKITTPTIYSISLDSFEGQFFEENEIYLEDTYLNIYHNLKVSAYTFTSEPGEFNNRFYLKFKAQTLTVEELDISSLVQIIQLNANEWIFKLESNQFKMRQLIIHDILGRQIYKFNAKSNRDIYNLPQLNSGAYVLTASSKNEIIFRKKFIKK